MRIKPWVITGFAALIATSAIGIMILSTDPAGADWRPLVLFWVALGIGIWALLATVFLACRMNIAQAVWASFWWSAGVFSSILFARAGYHDRRLLGGILFATLSLSLIAWWRLRNGRT